MKEDIKMSYLKNNQMSSTYLPLSITCTSSRRNIVIVMTANHQINVWESNHLASTILLTSKIPLSAEFSNVTICGEIVLST
jgi:hypothetical protein